MGQNLYLYNFVYKEDIKIDTDRQTADEKLKKRRTDQKTDKHDDRRINRQND